MHVNVGRADGTAALVGPYVPSPMCSTGVAQKMQACVLCKAPLLSLLHDSVHVSVRDLVFFFKNSAKPPVRWQVPAFAAFSQCFVLDDKTAIGTTSPSDVGAIVFFLIF